MMKCLLVILSFLVLVPEVRAEPEGTGWNGTAGFGPLAFSRYVGGASWQVWPVPLLSVNYNETIYVELLRAGAYLLASEDKKVGLGVAVEPRFGHSHADGPRLARMATRKSTLEGGPTFDWDFDVVAFSVAWFGDLGTSSRGHSARAAVYLPVLKDERWDFGTLLAADRLDGRRSAYYFGVQQSEALPGRAVFQPGAATNWSFGVSGTFNLDRHGAVMFGVSGTRLDGRLADSPIVERRHAAMAYLGYGWRL